MNKLSKDLFPDVTFVGMTNEPKARVLAQKICGMKYNCIADPSNAAAKYLEPFKVTGIPHAFVIHNREVKYSGHPRESGFLDALNAATGKSVTELMLLDDVPAIPESYVMVKGDKPKLEENSLKAVCFVSYKHPAFEDIAQMINELSTRFGGLVDFSVSFVESADDRDSATAAASVFEIPTGIDHEGQWNMSITELDKPFPLLLALVKQNKVIDCVRLDQAFRALIPHLIEEHGQGAVFERIADLLAKSDGDDDDEEEGNDQ